jgi:hypothetical protein
MPGKPNAATPEAERQAISSLLSDIGLAARAEYTSRGTGAEMFLVSVRLKDTFKYASAVHAALASGDHFVPIPAAKLEKMINPNLDAKLPVLLGLAADDGGHAVVVDGYGFSASTLYHHINMGWSGSDNAWYALPKIDADPAFDAIDECTYNIYTSGAGEIVSGRVLVDASAGAVPLSGAAVTLTGGAAARTATTDEKGIFAFKAVSPNTSYTVTASKSGYTFTSEQVETGLSKSPKLERRDGEESFLPPGTHDCGNVWNVVITGTEEPGAGEPVVPGRPGRRSSHNGCDVGAGFAICVLVGFLLLKKAR